MNLGIYSIKDIKCDAFMPLFVMQNDIQAMRAFYQTTEDPTTQLNKYPEDFVLFKIGNFDDKTGHLYEDLKYLISAIGVKNELFKKGENLNEKEN